MSLLARFVGVITSPKATFQSLVAHPKWLGMLATSSVAMAILLGGFMLTKVGQDAWLDAAANSPFSRGQMTDQQLQMLEKMAPFVGYGTLAYMLVVIPVLSLVIAGIMYAIFNAALGGSATFKQMFAVVVHALPIAVLGQLFTVPLNYARGTLTSTTNLSVFTQAFLSDTSFVSRLLGTVELFLVWQLIVLAIGLAVLYRRRTQPIALSFFAVYAVIAIIIAVVKTSFGGA